jgi:hypothetical protein
VESGVGDMCIEINSSHVVLVEGLIEHYRYSVLRGLQYLQHCFIKGVVEHHQVGTNGVGLDYSLPILLQVDLVECKRCKSIAQVAVEDAIRSS